MDIKKITENPKITDIVLIELPTPDSDGCYVADPYKVDSVKIFYVERNFALPNLNKYQEKHYNEEKLLKTITAEKAACDSPTEENINNAKLLRQELENTAKLADFFYDEAVPVKI